MVKFSSELKKEQNALGQDGLTIYCTWLAWVNYRFDTLFSSESWVNCTPQPLEYARSRSYVLQRTESDSKHKEIKAQSLFTSATGFAVGKRLIADAAEQAIIAMN